MNEFKYNVDTKYTVWERQYYCVKSDSKETADKLVTDILKGEVDDAYLYVGDCEVLYDTMDYMTTEENGGLSTIEVYDENFSLIYDNTTNKNNND
jgi:hypothetical protein